MMEWMWTELHADPQALKSSASVGNGVGNRACRGRELWSPGEDVSGGGYGGGRSGVGRGSWIQGPALELIG